MKMLLNINKTSLLKSLNFQKIKKSDFATNTFLKLSDEIKYSKKPIVALESTIITHGLPYPANLETALQVEDEVRKNNAVPATIAFLNGKFHVGLSRQEIEFIAKNHEKAIKISRRDMNYVCSRNDNSLIGGTTVSATSICAHQANISIFCTGGIGGVHRDFLDSMDVSADLQELARTPVAVVSSGVKSILDIEKTLEYLETQGVCVVTLNKTGSTEFPSFFTSKSGYNSPFNCKNEHEVAQLILHSFAKTGFNLNSGILIGVPIPEEHEADSNLIDNAINEALHECKKLNIKGKKVTPFLLEKINKITKGKSLQSNIALIKNNAKQSAKIAVELHKLQNYSSKIDPLPQNHVITVIGGTNLDYIYKLTDETTLGLKGVTQPCEFTASLGGVGRNMSEALFRLGLKESILMSALSDDLSGRYICDESKKIGLDISKLHVLDPIKNAITGTYCAVFHSTGEINMALGNMKAHDYITPEFIKTNLDILSKSQFCVLDADIPIDTIEYVSNYCQIENIPLWFNPTDLRKCYKLIDSDSLAKCTYISPNLQELFTLFSLKFQKDNSLNENEKINFHKINSKKLNLDFEDLK